MLTQEEIAKLKALVKELLLIKKPAAMEDFLYGLLTEKELREIPNRLEIVKLLKQGVPHHEIAEKLKVGVSTVTRGSKEIQKGRFKKVS